MAIGHFSGRRREENQDKTPLRADFYRSQSKTGSQDMITHERLHELLHYDSETGIFTWRVTRRGPARAGDVAGSVFYTRGKVRYIAIGVEGRRYLAHRLAWFYVHSEWPEFLDHRDCDGLNNRISNLRPSTRGQNEHNTGKRRNNTSGHKGVHWDKHRKKWVARLMCDGKMRLMKRFNTQSEAIEAHREAAQKHHGEFARTK